MNPLLLEHMPYRSKFRIYGSGAVFEKSGTMGEAIEEAARRYGVTGEHHAVEDSRTTKILYTTRGINYVA